MSEKARRFLAFILTWGCTRLVYGAADFRPLDDIPGLPGILLDLSMWILAFLSINVVLGLLFGRPKPRPPI
jgi:hypothetical protein